jgi:outer membrane protein
MFALVVNSGQAQEIWSLEKCIQVAWNNNLNLSNAELAIRSAHIAERTAKESRYPNLNLNSGANLNFGRSIDPTSNGFITENFLSNNLSISSGVVLFDGFRISHRIEQSKLDTEASKKDKAQMQRDIALGVANSYLNVLFAKENQRIAANTLNLDKLQLEQIKKLILAGTRPETETLDTEALIANDERQVIVAKNSLDIAMLQLKQAMLVEENFDVISPDNIQVETDADALQISEVYASALLNQESIKAAEIRKSSADLGIKLAKAQLYPSINIGGSLGTNYSNQGRRIDGYNDVVVNQDVFINGQSFVVGFPNKEPIISKNPYFNQFNENLSYGFGLSIQVPIYNNYQVKGSIENAKLQSQRSTNDLELAKQNLLTTVQQALADAKASKIAFAANQKAFDTQKRAYENTQKRFNVGAANSFELANQKARLDNTELNILISKYDYVFRSKVIDFYMGKQIKI